MEFLVREAVTQLAFEGSDGCSLAQLITCLQRWGPAAWVYDVHVVRFLGESLIRRQDVGATCVVAGVIVDDPVALLRLNRTEPTFSDMLFLTASTELRDFVLGVSVASHSTDVSPAMIQVLSTVAKTRTDGAVQSDISKVVEMEPQKVFYILKVLEQIGLVCKSSQTLHNSNIYLLTRFQAESAASSLTVTVEEERTRSVPSASIQLGSERVTFQAIEEYALAALNRFENQAILESDLIRKIAYHFDPEGGYLGRSKFWKRLLNRVRSALMKQNVLSTRLYYQGKSVKCFIYKPDQSTDTTMIPAESLLTTEEKQIEVNESNAKPLHDDRYEEVTESEGPKIRSNFYLERPLKRQMYEKILASCEHGVTVSDLKSYFSIFSTKLIYALTQELVSQFGIKSRAERKLKQLSYRFTAPLEVINRYRQEKGTVDVKVEFESSNQPRVDNGIDKGVDKGISLVPSSIAPRSSKALPRSRTVTVQFIKRQELISDLLKKYRVVTRNDIAIALQRFETGLPVDDVSSTKPPPRVKSEDGVKSEGPPVVDRKSLTRLIDSLENQGLAKSIHFSVQSKRGAQSKRHLVCCPDIDPEDAVIQNAKRLLVDRVYYLLYTSANESQMATSERKKQKASDSDSELILVGVESSPKESTAVAMEREGPTEPLKKRKKRNAVTDNDLQTEPPTELETELLTPVSKKQKVVTVNRLVTVEEMEAEKNRRFSLYRRVLSFGYITATMLRSRFLHQHLWQRAREPFAPRLALETVTPYFDRIFTVEDICYCMPVQLFAQIVGFATDIHELAPALTDGSKLIKDLPESIQKQIIRSSNRWSYVDRLKRTLDPLIRLGLIQRFDVSSSVLQETPLAVETVEDEYKQCSIFALHKEHSVRLSDIGRVSSSSDPNNRIYNTYRFDTLSDLMKFWTELEHLCTAKEVVTVDRTDVETAIEDVDENTEDQHRNSNQSRTAMSGHPLPSMFLKRNWTARNALSLEQVRFLEEYIAKKRTTMQQQQALNTQTEQSISTLSSSTPALSLQEYSSLASHLNLNVSHIVTYFDRRDAQPRASAQIARIKAQLKMNLDEPRSRRKSDAEEREELRVPAHVKAFKRRQRETLRHASMDDNDDEEEGDRLTHDLDVPSKSRHTWNRTRDVTLLRAYALAKVRSFEGHSHATLTAFSNPMLGGDEDPLAQPGSAVSSSMMLLKNKTLLAVSRRRGEIDWEFVSELVHESPSKCGSRVRYLLSRPEFAHTASAFVEHYTNIRGLDPLSVGVLGFEDRFIGSALPLELQTARGVVITCLLRMILLTNDDEYSPEKAYAMLKDFKEEEVTAAFDWLKLNGWIVAKKSGDSSKNRLSKEPAEDPSNIEGIREPLQNSLSSRGYEISAKFRDTIWGNSTEARRMQAFDESIQCRVRLESEVTTGFSLTASVTGGDVAYLLQQMVSRAVQFELTFADPMRQRPPTAPEEKQDGVTQAGSTLATSTVDKGEEMLNDYRMRVQKCVRFVGSKGGSSNLYSELDIDSAAVESGDNSNASIPFVDRTELKRKWNRLRQIENTQPNKKMRRTVIETETSFHCLSSDSSSAVTDMLPTTISSDEPTRHESTRHESTRHESTKQIPPVYDQRISATLLQLIWIIIESSQSEGVSVPYILKQLRDHEDFNGLPSDETAAAVLIDSVLDELIRRRIICKVAMATEFRFVSAANADLWAVTVTSGETAEEQSSGRPSSSMPVDQLSHDPLLELLESSLPTRVSSLPDSQSVLRPWLQLNGETNWKLLTQFVRRLLFWIIRYPGLQLKRLMIWFPVLHPQEVRELLSVMEIRGLISSRLVGEGPASLFSNFQETRATDSTEESVHRNSHLCYFPSLSCYGYV